MSRLENDPAACPFSGSDGELVNVKFFRGTRDDLITGEEMLEQSRSARNQVTIGTALVSKFAPKSAHPSINVAEFVASL